jgi:hypothetical protein
MVLDPGPSLFEAATYIDRFRDKHVIVKLGGELFDHESVIERLVPQIAVLYRCGLRPVLVHGGGKQIDERCQERGIAIENATGAASPAPKCSTSCSRWWPTTSTSVLRAL